MTTTTTNQLDDQARDRIDQRIAQQDWTYQCPTCGATTTCSNPRALARCLPCWNKALRARLAR